MEEKYSPYGGFEEFVEGLGNEDFLAWELLVKKFSRDTKKYMARRTGDSNLLDEALADSYLRLLKAFRRIRDTGADCRTLFPSEEKFFAYWLKVNYNSFLTLWAKQCEENPGEADYQRMAELFLGSAEEAEGPPTPEQAWLSRFLRGFMAKIADEKHRKIYELYLKGNSIEELAERFRRHPNSVKVIIHRLNKKIILSARENLARAEAVMTKLGNQLK